MKLIGYNYSSSFWTKISCQTDTKYVELKVLCLQYAHFKLANRKKIRW